MAMDSPAVATEDLGVTRLVKTCRHVFCRKEYASYILSQSTTNKSILTYLMSLIHQHLYMDSSGAWHECQCRSCWSTNVLLSNCKNDTCPACRQPFITQDQEPEAQVEDPTTNPTNEPLDETEELFWRIVSGAGLHILPSSRPQRESRGPSQDNNETIGMYS